MQLLQQLKTKCNTSYFKGLSRE
jgi:hypothetical protein